MINKIKRAFLLLTLIAISTTVVAEGSQPMKGSCGIKDGDVAPFSFAICPDDAGYKVLFSVMPNLYTLAVDGFGLDYAEGLKSNNPIPKGSTPKSVAEVASAEITELSISIATVMLGFGTWVLVLSHMKPIKSGGKKVFDVDYPSTIFYVLFAAFLLMPMSGFYGYQWVIAGISLLALSMFNFFVSTLLYYYSQMIVPTDAPLWTDDNLNYEFEAEQYSMSDIKYALCGLQAAHQNYGQTDNSYFSLTPSLDSLSMSLYEDDVSSLLEVKGESVGREIFVGIGVGHPDSAYRADGFWDVVKSLFKTKPINCGSENFGLDKGDMENGGFSAEVYQDFQDLEKKMDKLPQMFEKAYAKAITAQHTSEGIVTVQHKAMLLTNYYKMALIALRDPIMSDFRLETFGAAIDIASSVRKLECLQNYSTYQSNKNTLACKTILAHSDSYDVPQLRSEPIEFFDDAPDKKQTPQQIIDLKQEIFDARASLKLRYEEMLSQLAKAYVESNKFVARSGSDVNRIRAIRQEGFVRYFREFFELSYIVESRVRYGNDFYSIFPVMTISDFDEYYLALWEDSFWFTHYVAKITLPQDEFAIVSSSRFGERSVDVLLGGDPKIDSFSQLKNTMQLKHLVNGFTRSLSSLTDLVSLTISQNAFKGVDFGLNTDKSLMGSYYVGMCLSGDTSSFSEALINHCELIKTHPFYLLKSLGSHLFVAGGGLLMTKKGLQKAHNTVLESQTKKRKAKLKQSDRELLKGGAVVDKAPSKRIHVPLPSIPSSIIGLLSIIGNVLGTLGFVLVIVGFIVTIVLPLIPVVSAITIMIGWFVLVLVSLVFGSMFVPFMLSTRKKSQGGEGLVSGGFLKTYVHIMLKPLVVAVSLALIWVALDIAMKITYFMIQFIFSGVNGRVTVDLLSSILPVLYTIFCMVLLIKVFTQVSTMSGKLSEAVLQFSNAGASKVSSAAGDKIVGMMFTKGTYDNTLKSSRDIVNKVRIGESRVRKKSNDVSEYLTKKMSSTTPENDQPKKERES